MFHQVMINKNILLPIGYYSKLFVDMGASASLRTITCSFSYTIHPSLHQKQISWLTHKMTIIACQRVVPKINSPIIRFPIDSIDDDNNYITLMIRSKAEPRDPSSQS